MKRHLPLAAILVLAFASFAFAQEATPSPSPKPRVPRVTKAQLTKQLSGMETALWTAWKNKDPKPFDMHLTADAVLIDSQGVSSKSSIAEGMKACEIGSFNLSDWKLTKINASTAILNYKATQSGTCAGNPIPGSVWASSIWVRRKGAWVAAFHQETPAM